MTLLEVKSLNTYYGESHILRNVDMNVRSGEMVCLIGRNGVGKTTLLKSLIGLLKPRGGDIIFKGSSLVRQEPHRRAKLGVAYVPQGREIIPYLTVEENLMLGLESLPGGLSKNNKIDPFVYDLFPILKDFLQRKGGDLSGGQQQQLAIARALLGKPELLLLDEPTAALSPLYQQQIIERIDALREEGITVLIVEQNARLSLARSDRGYIFANGKVVHTGDAQHILKDPEIGEYFLGSH